MCVCAQGSVGTGVQVLSVWQGGIKLLKTVKSSAAEPDYFRVLNAYTYGAHFSHQAATVSVSFLFGKTNFFLFFEIARHTPVPFMLHLF